MSITTAVKNFINSKEFRKLINKGKDQRYLTPEEINDAIPASIISIEEVDFILTTIFDQSIDIQVQEFDEDEEGIKLDGTEIIEETLSKEEQAELKSSSTDPVKLYLKRMGSVALLTREGEVKIAKEIEEGEKEIILSTLHSTHALTEITKLKEKIESAENQIDYVRDLVRGLDDESTKDQVEKTKAQICKVCDTTSKLIEETVNEDGTFKKLTKEQIDDFETLGERLVELTFNRKIINSFVDPVKDYFLRFKDLYEQQDRIFKFLEVSDINQYRVLYNKVIDNDSEKRKLAKELYTSDSKIEQLLRNQEDILRKLRRLSLEAGMEYDEIEKLKG